jgi:hypothetical protein
VLKDILYVLNCGDSINFSHEIVKKKDEIHRMSGSDRCIEQNPYLSRVQDTLYSEIKGLCPT